MARLKRDAREDRRAPRRDGRGRTDEVWLYGWHTVRAALMNPERRCRRLLCTAATRDAVAALVQSSRAAGRAPPRPEEVEPDALARRLSPQAVHQGLALLADPLPAWDLDDLGRAAAVRPGTVVVLERVTDPHNVGAVLRSAAAFGALGLVLGSRQAPSLTGVLAKAASGAVEHVPIVRVGNLAAALERLKDWGFFVVGLTEQAERALDDLDGGARIALVLGSEGEGLRRLTRERCDALARLATTGPIASLNVSNAAAVALYALRRPGVAADLPAPKAFATVMAPRNEAEGAADMPTGGAAGRPSDRAGPA